jgi:hypothetical protein
MVQSPGAWARVSNSRLLPDRGPPTMMSGRSKRGDG